MNIDDEFRDLAPLSPKLRPGQWDRMTAAIEAAAAPELARRSRLPDTGLMAVLFAWTRPAASAAVAFASAAGLVLALAAPRSEPLPPGVADALGYPDAVAVWLETGTAPSVEELLVAVDGSVDE